MASAARRPTLHVHSAAASADRRRAAERRKPPQAHPAPPVPRPQRSYRYLAGLLEMIAAAGHQDFVTVIDRLVKDYVVMLHLDK